MSLTCTGIFSQLCSTVFRMHVVVTSAMNKDDPRTRCHWHLLYCPFCHDSMTFILPYKSVVLEAAITLSLKASIKTFLGGGADEIWKKWNLNRKPGAMADFHFSRHQRPATESQQRYHLKADGSVAPKCQCFVHCLYRASAWSGGCRSSSECKMAVPANANKFTAGTVPRLPASSACW